MQLLVEALQRAKRILSKADKVRLEAMLTPYIQDGAGIISILSRGKKQYSSTSNR